MNQIVGTHVLPRRDVPVHEAAHYIIAKVFNMKPKHPYISPDRKSGLVSYEDRDSSQPRVPKEVIFDAFSAHIIHQVAVERSAVSFAGYAAEAHLTRCLWADHYIIADPTGDLENVRLFLSDARIPEREFEAWQYSRELVKKHWCDIFDFAQTL